MEDTFLEEAAPKFYGAVTVGERGQIVIPIEARKELGLEPGNKLLVFGDRHRAGLMLSEVQYVAGFLTRAMTLLTQFEDVLRNNPDLTSRNE